MCLENKKRSLLLDQYYLIKLMALKIKQNIIVLIFLTATVIVACLLKNKTEGLPKKNKIIRQSVLFAVPVKVRDKRKLKKCISLLNFHSTSSPKNRERT